MAKKSYIGVSEYEKYNLPNGYTQLTYIESTGTQYIDTTFVFTDTSMTLELTAQYTGSAPSATIFFCGFKPGSTSTPRASIMLHSNDTFMFGINTTGTTGVSYDNNKHTLKLVGDNGTQKGYIDNSVVYEDTCANTGFSTNTHSMYLFGRNSDNSANGLINMRLYSCKIYNNKTIVRNFVPCKNASNVVGLYDVVNGVFYENAGTGTFTEGAVATFDDTVAHNIKKMYLGIEETYTELEYIQSSGTQYINTGVIGKSGLEANLKISFSTVGSYGILSALNNNTRIYLVHMSSSKWGYGYGSWYASNTTVNANQIYNIYSKLYAGEQILKIDDTVISTGSDTSTYNTTIPLFLLTYNNAGTAGNLASAKLYSCQISDNGTLIRDFVPVKSSSGVVGLYDKVEGKFYGNAGTGEFTAGTVLSNKIYVSIAHKVKKAYLGDPNSIAKLVFRSEKDPGSVSISPSSITLNGSTLSKIINVTRSGSGTITAKSSNTSVANVSISGTKVTVNSVNYTSGTATITITVAEDEDYTSVQITCPITASFNISHYKTISGDNGLPIHRYNVAGASIGNYAIFAGGDTSTYNPVTNVDAFNKSFTRSTVSSLDVAATQKCGLTLGNYAVFGGGYTRSGDGVYLAIGYANAYNASLTKQSLSSVPGSNQDKFGTVIGNNAIFFNSSSSTDKTVTFGVLSSSFTTSLITANVTRSHVKDSYSATSTKDYAIIYIYFSMIAVKYYFGINSSLTITVNDGPTAMRYYTSASAYPEYAIFGGSSSTGNTVAINNSLTVGSCPALSIRRDAVATTSLGNYAIFAGGVDDDTNDAVTTVDTFNTSLTRSVFDMAYTREQAGAASLGSYALIAGGGTSAIDVFTV